MGYNIKTVKFVGMDPNSLENFQNVNFSETLNEKEKNNL